MNSLPKRSKMRIMDLRPDIPHSVVERHRKMLEKWFNNEMSLVEKGRPNEIQKIFNENIDVKDFSNSKRMQVEIGRGCKTLSKSDLLRKYLVPYLNDFGKPFGLRCEKILLLISDKNCPSQIEHVDDSTGKHDFVVGIYTLQDDTHIKIQNECIDGKPLIEEQFNANTLVLFSSKKVHGGGSNFTADYNFRYHFRLTKDGRKVIESSDSAQVGVVKKCRFGGCEYRNGNKNTLQSHQRLCKKNQDRESNRVRKNSTSQKSKKKRKSEKNDE